MYIYLCVISIEMPKIDTMLKLSDMHAVNNVDGTWGLLDEIQAYRHIVITAIFQVNRD